MTGLKASLVPRNGLVFFTKLSTVEPNCLASTLFADRTVIRHLPTDDLDEL